METTELETEPEETLIELVQQYPTLYDKSTDDYKLVEHKEIAWKNISEQLDIEVSECQRIWLQLRDRFTRENRAYPSGQSTWKFFDTMQYIVPVTVNRPRRSNLDMVVSIGTPKPITPEYLLDATLFDDGLRKLGVVLTPNQSSEPSDICNDDLYSYAPPTHGSIAGMAVSLNSPKSAAPKYLDTILIDDESSFSSVAHSPEPFSDSKICVDSSSCDADSFNRELIDMHSTCVDDTRSRACTDDNVSILSKMVEKSIRESNSSRAVDLEYAYFLLMRCSDKKLDEVVNILKQK